MTLVVVIKNGLHTNVLQIGITTWDISVNDYQRATVVALLIIVNGTCYEHFSNSGNWFLARSAC